jgi:inner membrane protein
MLALYTTHAFWFWLALAAAILAAEVATNTGWLLWASASAGVVALLAFFLGPDPAVAIIAFAVLTLASTLLAHRYFPKKEMAAGGDINDNVSRLIGQEARAVGAFSNGAGRVLIDGKEWVAELEDGHVMASGARLQVVAVRDGSRLRVRLVD